MPPQKNILAWREAFYTSPPASIDLYCLDAELYLKTGTLEFSFSFGLMAPPDGDHIALACFRRRKRRRTVFGIGNGLINKKATHPLKGSLLSNTSVPEEKTSLATITGRKDPTLFLPPQFKT
jgi:hypothetical protein